MAYVAVQGFGYRGYGDAAADAAAQAQYQSALNTYNQAVAARQAVLDQVAQDQATYQSALMHRAQLVQSTAAENSSAQATYHAQLLAGQNPAAPKVKPDPPSVPPPPTRVVPPMPVPPVAPVQTTSFMPGAAGFPTWGYVALAAVGIGGIYLLRKL